jgi:hypothetical protein
MKSRLVPTTFPSAGPATWLIARECLRYIQHRFGNSPTLINSMALRANGHYKRWPRAMPKCWAKIGKNAKYSSYEIEPSLSFCTEHDEKQRCLPSRSSIVKTARWRKQAAVCFRFHQSAKAGSRTRRRTRPQRLSMVWHRQVHDAAPVSTSGVDGTALNASTARSRLAPGVGPAALQTRRDATASTRL